MDEKVQVIRFLAEVARKAPPWDGKWWGTQPARGKPPARTIDWSQTPRVLKGFRSLVKVQNHAVHLVPLRLAAVEAIVDINDRESLPMLRSQFAGENDVAVRRAIALALGKLADKEALDVLIAALRDPKSPNRSAMPRSRPSRRSARIRP